MIGFDQSWINVELCLIIKYNIQLITRPLSRPHHPIKCIKNGRIAVATFILIFFISIAVTGILGFGIINNSEIISFIQWSQILEFLMLTTSICCLMLLLSKFNIHEIEKEAFNNEKRVLFFILILFDISFIARVFYDIYHVKNSSEEDETMTYAITGITICPFLDYIPICLILFIHLRNMK